MTSLVCGKTLCKRRLWSWFRDSLSAVTHSIYCKFVTIPANFECGRKAKEYPKYFRQKYCVYLQMHHRVALQVSNVGKSEKNLCLDRSHGSSHLVQQSRVFFVSLSLNHAVCMVASSRLAFSSWPFRASIYAIRRWSGDTTIRWLSMWLSPSLSPSIDRSISCLLRW